VESRPHFIFLNRAYIICNNWSLFHDEFSRLSLIFSNNGYPKSVFDTCVQKFLDKKYSNGQTSDNTKDEQLVNFSIPYIGHASLVYKKKLVNVFKSIGIEIRVVFKSFKVKNYFALKEVTTMNLSQMSFINFLALVIRAFPTLEKPNDIFSSDSWSTEEVALLYLVIVRNVNIVKIFRYTIFVF